MVVRTTGIVNTLVLPHQHYRDPVGQLAQNPVRRVDFVPDTRVSERSLCNKGFKYRYAILLNDYYAHYLSPETWSSKDTKTDSPDVKMGERGKVSNFGRPSPYLCPF